jgi:predicted  nucleic acid-binding Zn-ribbon protein
MSRIMTAGILVVLSLALASCACNPNRGGIFWSANCAETIVEEQKERLYKEQAAYATQLNEQVAKTMEIPLLKERRASLQKDISQLNKAIEDLEGYIDQDKIKKARAEAVLEQHRATISDFHQEPDIRKDAEEAFQRIDRLERKNEARPDDQATT